MNWRRTPKRRVGRLTRLGALVLVGAGAGIGGLVLLTPLAARGLVSVIGLLARACVWMATSISEGVSVWTIAAILWQTGVDALATPIVSVVMWALVLIGLLAFYWLQRLIGSDEESS